ncbi:50S ribosomal protein L4 [Patescibacteria group bacterium]|nr:50S ribosomal protein L4 [Patescibacteria group bacterium]MBU1895775.1 50S ribosomal protein L4 [Patescibacteria group bacterium]
MPKVDLYNSTGEKSGEVELNDVVFGVKPKQSVVHQVYTALMANARQPWADTKTRGDVRGGGRKPWKQKGTGRARHGSIRSPLWKGGGVTFGPLKERNYKQKINKKLNQSATRMCLSGKVLDNKLIVLESFATDGKTQVMSTLRDKLPGKGKTTMLLTGKKDEMVLRSANNLQKLDVGIAKDVSVVDLLHHQFIITTKEGIKSLESRLAK